MDLPDLHDAVGLGIRKGAEEDPVDDAEDRRGSADPDGKGKNRRPRGPKSLGSPREASRTSRATSITTLDYEVGTGEVPAKTTGFYNESVLTRMRPPLPEGHPLRALFHRLTARGLEQVGLRDPVLLRYLSDMLVRFVHVDDLYRLRDPGGLPVDTLAEMIVQADASPRRERRDAYRHVGDFSLFVLGFYPESLRGRRMLVGPDYYAEQGRRCYGRAADMGNDVPPSSLLKQLVEHFESCAVGLHWVRDYTHEPFYQYMLRQYGLL
jgi:hypothetical protein